MSERDPFTQGRETLKTYATAHLLAQIDKMMKGPDGLDGDYFLDAQDFDKEWARNIKITNTEIKDGKATADVTLDGKEMGQKTLHLSLAQESGAWKVDRVTGQ